MQGETAFEVKSGFPLHPFPKTYSGWERIAFNFCFPRDGFSCYTEQDFGVFTQYPFRIGFLGVGTGGGFFGLPKNPPPDISK